MEDGRERHPAISVRAAISDWEVTRSFSRVRSLSMLNIRGGGGRNYFQFADYHPTYLHTSTSRIVFFAKIQ